MVACNFNTGFITEIVAGRKTQTIRLPRKRHAMPGEYLQLFTGMRSRHCRKIIPDPLCVGLDSVRIDLRGDAPLLEVNGIPVTGADAETYATSDGFGGPSMRGAALTPFTYMMRWWAMTHGRILFEGVAIRWSARGHGHHG